MKFTAIDFETANASRASACAIGLVMVENGQIVGRMSHLIRPDPLDFDPFNVSIHGISAADVKDAPTFSELWPILWPRISGPLIAHNAAFDMSVLRRALDHSGIQYPKTDYFCTRVISSLAWPDYPTFALAHIANILGISFNHHDAEEDARACAIIAIEACNRLGASSLYNLEKTCGLRIGHLYPGGYCPCGCTRPPDTLKHSGIEIFISRTGASIKRIQPPCTTEDPNSVHGVGNPSGRVTKTDLPAGTVTDKHCPEIKAPHTTENDKRHQFYGMSFVFTGAMTTMTRIHAMQAVLDRGGIYHDTLKSDTNYLVLGQEGFIGYQAGHKSSKMKKADAMRNKGIPIEILSEADFVGMLDGEFGTDEIGIF